MLGLFSKNRMVEAEAGDLYRAIVARARHPDLYAKIGVADTLDGRFEMLILHMALVLRRLGQLDQGELAQSTIDLMFDDMDQALREIGVSDIAVAKKIRPMAEAYAGRSAAYEAALAQDAPEQQLQVALARNVFSGESDFESAEALAAYARRLEAVLASASRDDLLGEAALWPDPVEGGE